MTDISGASVPAQENSTGTAGTGRHRFLSEVKAFVKKND